VTRVRIEAARPADFGQTQAINGVLRSYAADVTTLDMAERVAQILGENANPEALLNDVGATADAGSREIQVKFKSPDPAWAERVSSVWADVLVARRDEANLALDERQRVFAQKRDATTHHQYSPRKKLLAGVGGVLGVAVGALLAFGWEYASAGQFRDPLDVAESGFGPVLGAVRVRPRRRGSGIDIVVSDFVAPAAVGLRRLWPVAALAVAGAVLAYGFSAARPTVYRARTRVAIEPALTSDWGQTQAIREIMRGYAEDIATLTMAGEVSSRLELDEPADAVLKQVNVAPNEAVYEIWIDVRDRDAATATAMSRTWAEIFAEERIRANQELDARDRIYARTRDRTLSEVYTPKPKMNALAGAVVGAAVGAAALYVLYRREEDRLDGKSRGQAAPRALGLIPERLHG
jgi:capsular polysaccharide biosynthesis protein